MADYELSERAEQRLAEIYEYSIEEFGLKTARRYLNGLHQTFGRLAENHNIGTDLSEVRPATRRLVHESHVVYYEPTAAGILIVEVLHQLGSTQWLAQLNIQSRISRPRLDR